MYRVKELFVDLQDNNHRYEVGDEYPRLGLNPDLSRITELSSDKNKRGIPLIEEISDLEGDETTEEESVDESAEEETEEAEEEKPEPEKKASPKRRSSSKKNSNK